MAFKAFAPASVSNMATGFDIMGFALTTPGDEVVVKPGKQSGVVITKITKGKGLPFEISKNTAGVAVTHMLDYLGMSDKPIEIEIRKKMSYGSGIGSSASSAVAAVMALNKYLKTELTKHELLPFAMAGEKALSGVSVADNVIPSMMGGIILIRDSDTLDFTKLYIPSGLRYVVILPRRTQILTSDSRSRLRDTVSLTDMVKQSANAATLVAALYSSDFDKISRCLEDTIIEPQRAHLIPHFYEMKKLALEAGALGFSISGSGPAMFALCNSTFIANNIVEAAQSLYGESLCKIYNDMINHEGAEVC